MMLVYFSSGRCVIDVVNYQTNRQFTSIMVEHFVNSARVSWIIRRTVFNMYVCLNRGCSYEHSHFKMRDEKPRHQRQFLYLDVFRKW